MPTLSTNRTARFNYEILETIEAGIVLSGDEVKSVRAGGMRLTESFVTFRGERAVLTNAHISRYAKSNPIVGYDPEHTRELLLHKSQILHLLGKKTRDGLTIVPLSAYTSRGRIKIEIGLARGKKTIDKRESIKRRESDREIARAMKARR